jgi:diguanylate cyclase (GGDEF)-like protein
MLPRFRRFTSSIVTRFVFVGVMVVVFGSVLRFVMLTTWLRQDIEQLISEERLTLANFAAASVDRKLLERQAVLDRVADDLSLEATSADLQALRARLAQRAPLLTPLFAQLALVESRPDTATRGFKPRVDTTAAKPSLRFSTPVIARSGEMVGVLSGTVALGALDLFDMSPGAERPISGGLLLISPADGVFVASTDPAMVLTPLPPPGVNLLHDRAMAGHRGTGITRNAKGVEELSGMASVPMAKWFVVARIPTSEAFAAVTRTRSNLLRATLLNLALVVALVTGLLWWALKPLFDAARHADAMTSGDAPLQPLRVVRDDEVGHLTTAFNGLLAKLSDSQAELSRQAHHDALTGLPNRRLLADRLEQALARARRNGTRIALLVLDLDGFKLINDTHGHDAGDDALRATAERFAGALRADDTLARVGGDEFVLLATDLPGSADEVRKGADTLAARCVALAQQPLDVRGRPMRLGVSIGVIVCNGDASADQALTSADRAMYEAKQAGRGRHVFASGSS